MLDTILHSPEWRYLLRILLAAVCGGAIGLERSRRQKEAGVRTHVLVALGAALVMVVSKYGFTDLMQGASIDVSRIAANVVSGVSFLGAGIIFLKGDSIKGLTTAAGVWATAGVGLAAGAGMHITAVCATLLILLLQSGLHRSLRRIEGVATGELTVRLGSDPEEAARLQCWLTEHHVIVGGCTVQRTDEGITLRLLVKLEEGMTIQQIVTLLMQNPVVCGVSL